MNAKPQPALLITLIAVSLALPIRAQQASVTLLNSDAKFCYKHDNNWALTKAVTTADIVDGVGNVTWTINATKSSGATSFAVYGGLTISNSGSAPATIANIVINLQKPNNKKIGGKLVSWVSAAADVATATSGDAATSANIVASGSAEGQPFNAAYGAGNYSTSGDQGTFTETAGSGALEFTDAADNTLFSLVPQPVIPAGASITLLYKASFSTSILPAAGTPLRVEALVTFGNAGARGGGGAVGSNIDANGSGSLDSDEAKVRTVPSRVTLAPLPTAPEECNTSVTLSDLGVSTFGTVATLNPTGFGAAVISSDRSFVVSVDVVGGVDGGSVCNEATLTGQSDSVSLLVVIGQTLVGYDTNNLPIFEPIFASMTCCRAAEAKATACQSVGGVPQGCGAPFCPGDYCTYTQGGYQGRGVPGQLFDNNFLTNFPSGLVIGIDDLGGPRHSAKWTATATGLANLKTYLAGGGPSGALTADTEDATSTSGGTLAKQTATLTINVVFSDAGLTQPGFSSLKLCNTGKSLDGQTVGQILVAANMALGGAGLPSGYSFGDLNSLVTRLNEAFDNCTPSSWSQTNLCR